MLDVNHIEGCSRFWSEILGETISFKADRYCRIGLGDNPPSLLLQKVLERRERKNRAHIDLDVTDLGPAVERAVSLGGAKLEENSQAVNLGHHMELGDKFGSG